MSRAATTASRPLAPDQVFESPRGRAREIESLPAPLVWTFDGPFERCLADLEDTLRRAIVLVGDVSRVALLIDLSLPALLARVAAGDACSRRGAASPTASPATACPPSRACATCARPARWRRSSSPIAADRNEPRKPVMSMKSWVLHRVAGRSDLPQRDVAPPARARHRPRCRRSAPATPPAPPSRCAPAPTSASTRR